MLDTGPSAMRAHSSIVSTGSKGQGSRVAWTRAPLQSGLALAPSSICADKDGLNVSAYLDYGAGCSCARRNGRRGRWQWTPMVC